MRPTSRRGFVKSLSGLLVTAPIVLDAGPAFASGFSFVASAGVSASGTTAGINTTGANLIVMAVGSFGARPPGDSNGNTWTSILTETSSVQLELFYCLNPTVGAGHTFNATPGAGFYSLCVAAFSGAASSAALDQQNGATNSGATTIQPGSITPTQANELVIASVGTDTGTLPMSAYTIGGFTIPTGCNQIPISGTTEGSALGYLIQTSAAASNPTCGGFGNGGGAEAIIASFKSNGAPSPSNKLFLSSPIP